MKAQPAASDTCGGLPPGVVPQVPVERGADRRPAAAIERDQQILMQHVPIVAHVIHELGDISALPGEDHLGGGVSQSAPRHRLALTHMLVH